MWTAPTLKMPDKFGGERNTRYPLRDGEARAGKPVDHGRFQLQQTFQFEPAGHSVGLSLRRHSRAILLTQASQSGQAARWVDRSSASTNHQGPRHSLIRSKCWSLVHAQLRTPGFPHRLASHRLQRSLCFPTPYLVGSKVKTLRLKHPLTGS